MSTKRKSSSSPSTNSSSPADGLADFATFTALSPAEKSALAEAVAAELGDAFRAGEELVGEAKLATIVHVSSDIELVLVPGGSFVMGFTERDQAAVDACFPGKEGASVRKAVARTIPLMQPAHEVSLRPFAIAREPVGDAAVLETLLGEPQDPNVPREVASAILARWGFRFPSEAEWEYVAREGWGLSFLLDAAATFREDAEERLETAWGVGTLGQAVWIGDRWHRTYAKAPTDGSAWTTGKGRGMYRGSFSLGLSEMQSDHELVFALTPLRVEPLEQEDDTEVWLRPALGPGEDGKWRAVRGIGASAGPGVPVATSPSVPSPDVAVAASSGPASDASPEDTLAGALAEPDPKTAGARACTALLSLGLPNVGQLVPLASELSAGLRDALLEIVRRRPDLPLFTVAVPAHPDVRRRWLGLSPGGVLERPVSLARDGGAIDVPLWRAYALLDEEHAFGDDGQVRGLLPVEETLEAFLEIALTSGYANGRHDPTPREVVAAGVKQAPWAAATLTRFEAEIASGRRIVLTTGEALALLYPLAEAGHVIEPHWTALLPLTAPEPVSIVWNAVPEPAREAAMIAALERALPTTGVFKQPLAFVARFPRPALAQTCLAYLSSKDASRQHGAATMRFWIDALRAICEDDDALRSVLPLFPQKK